MQKETIQYQGTGSVFFKRSVALFLSISQILMGSPAFPAEIPKTELLKPPGIQVEFKIPEKLGSLEEFHTVPCASATAPLNCSPKTVIYIQDAHDSLEAQKNIAKLIHLFVAKYGVKTVLEEGYEGPVPTDKYFGQIKDPQIRKKVAYFLMDKLRLGGAEYAHITRFEKVRSLKLEVGRKAADKISKIRSLGDHPAKSKENLLSSNFQLPTRRATRGDFQLVGADSLLLHRKNIERYQAAEKNRKATQEDLLVMDAEIRKMTQRYFSRELKEGMGLKEKLDRKELDLMDYLKRTQALFLKGIGFEEFRTAYPNLSLLLSAAETKDEKLLAKLKASVSYKAIFQEISRLEDDYAETHLSRERDRQIFDYYKLIQLLKRLNHMEVTEEEYAALKDNLRGMNTAKIADFIAAETNQSLVLSKLWEKNIQNAVQFYEIARERDGSIQGRLEDYVAGDDQSPVVLVYGGFHKGRVKELIEQSGLSYAVVSPRITSVSPRHQAYYRQLMRMGYDTMAIPKLVATATSPPRLLDFAALSAKSEIRMREQLDFLTQIARKDSSKQLDASVGAMDLALGKQRHAKARSADSSVSLRSEVRSGFESYKAAVGTALGELSEIKNQMLTIEVQKKLADAYTALLRGLYPADQGKVFMVFPALKADLFLSLEFPGLYLNRSTDDFGEGLSILSKLKDRDSSEIMSSLIKNFRFTRVEANPLDLSYYEVLRDRQQSKIEGKVVFVMKGFRREFETWGKDVRFVNQVLKDLKEGDEILILDRDDLAFAVEQGWMRADEGARQTIPQFKGENDAENLLELSYGRSQGQKIQLPDAVAVIAVPKGGVTSMTSRVEGGAVLTEPAMSETTASWNEPWIMLPGQLTRDVSLVDLAEKQRANPSQEMLDSRVQPVADELRKMMAEVHAQLPDVDSILNDARIKMPSYLTETAHDHQNMINLSGPLRAPVFLPELFQEVMLSMLESAPEKVILLLESLQGFMVHEYGHIVDANGGLVQTDREGQKAKRSHLIQKYGLTKKDRAVILDVQGDLRAESYRHHFLDRFKASAAYGEDHYYNLQPESVHWEWKRDLIYMAAWTIDFEKNGPASRSRNLAARVQSAQNLSPEQIEFYADFVSYFRGYFESLRYEPDWRAKLTEKDGVLPVVRDRMTGIPMEFARSEVRSAAEDVQSELTALGVEYQSRRSEIIANSKDQDYQKAQKNAQLVNEVAVKIFNLGLRAVPAVKDLAVIALADQEKVPPFDLGRILKSQGDDSEGAAFIQDATGIVFGKAWDVIDVQAADPTLTARSPDDNAVKLAEKAIEFIGEQWVGGSETLRAKRREQYRFLVQTAAGLRTEYDVRRAEVWHDESLTADEKMLRHAEIADEVIRKLYEFVQQLYADQSRQIALVAYGGQGRKEMHLSSDSEGRIIIQNETDALEAGRFFRNATEWIFERGSRWLLMLDREPIRMNVEPNAALEIQQRQIVQATELLDMRIIAGSPEIAESFTQSSEQQLFEQGLELTQGLIDVWNGRYREAGFVEGLYEREPDVKDGTGGLRTMHYVRWIAQAYTQKKDGYWEELIRLKLLKKKELERALRSYEFLNRVRGELGPVKQSSNDPNRLTLDAQLSVAYALGYKDSALEGAAVDQMLRDYDAHAVALFRFSYKVIRRISESENMRPVREVLVDGDLYQGKVKLDARRATRSGYIFQLSRGFRELKEPKTFLVPAVKEDGQPQDKISPESVMPLFLYAVENELKFSGQLLDVLEKASPHFRNKFLADKKFRNESQAYFKSLLADPHQTAYVLERMYLLGILPVLLPGFKETGYRPRLEMDYRTTLDWYALQSVDALDKFMSGQLSELEGSEISEAAKAFFKRMSQSPPLLRRIRLALLLQKFDDVSLRAVMKLMKLNKKTVTAVEWMRAHPNDLNELIRADAFWQSDILPAYVEKEIGPNTELWAFFIGASLARLYALRPEQFWLYLEAVEPAFKLETRFGQPAELSERLAHDHGTVNKLMQLFFGGPREDKKTVVLVEPLNEKREGSAKVTVYHRPPDDLPGWLERIAGVFAANGLSIESETVGDILGENVIIDRFIVTLPPTQLLPGQKRDFSKVWNDMERQLNENVRDALERDIPVSRIFDNKKGLALPYVSTLPKTLLNRPTIVSFDEGIRVGNLPQGSAGLTTLRVETADRPMLLYVLTKIIAAHGLNIHTGSTIDTEGYDDRIGRQAVDTFILSYQGSPLTISQQVDLLRDLHFWLNHESIDLAQLDRHRELLIYKRKIQTYLSQMKEKSAVRIAYVGDIHGDFERFNQIVSRLERQGVQKIIFMGDFIDHGSQGKEVIQAVRHLMEQGKAVALMGNHELMFIESILAPGSAYSRRFDLWLSSGGWAFLREFFGDSIRGVDISAEGSQKIKFGQEEFFIVMEAAKKNKDLIELAQWMKANLKLFHEDENMGFSVHARLKIDAQGELSLEEDDSGRGVRRGGREILNNMQADWNRGDPQDELMQGLLDYRLPQSTLLLGGDLPTELLNVPVPSDHPGLQGLLTSLRSLRLFNGHIEPNETPQEHIDLSRGSSGVFNSIDYGIRKGMGGYVVSSSEGIRYFLLSSLGTSGEDQEKPVYELKASAVIKQAEGMLAAIETAIHANTQSVKPAQSGSARSELRSSESLALMTQFSSDLFSSSRTFGSLKMDLPYLRHGAMVALVQDWHEKNPGKKLLIFNVDSHADNYGRGGDWDFEWAEIVERKGWADVIHLPSFYDEALVRVTPSHWDKQSTKQSILKRLRTQGADYAEIWGTVDYDFFSLLQPYLAEGEDYLPLRRELLDAFHLDEPARETEIALLAKFFSDHQIKLSRLVPVISPDYLNLPEEGVDYYIDSVTASLQRHFGGLGLKQRALRSILNPESLRSGSSVVSDLEAEIPYARYTDHDLTLLVRHGYKPTSEWGDRGHEHRTQTAGKLYARLSDWAAYKHKSSPLRVLTADYGDNNHLLSEVISNALKAVEETKAGQGLVSIRFGGTQTENYFEAADQGNGISDEAWETLGLEKGTYRPKGREGVGVGIVRSFKYFLRTNSGSSIEVLSRTDGVVQGFRFYFDSLQGDVVRQTLERAVLRTLNPRFGTSLRITFPAGRSEVRNQNDEVLYHVGENDEVLGTITRGQAHASPYPIFRTVDIFPVTASGEIVLQRRALYRGSPGLIDLTGGHVKYGQTYAEAGLEEANQELPFSLTPDRLKAVSIEADSIFKTRIPTLKSNRQVFVVPMSESETQSVQDKNALLKKFWNEIYQEVGKAFEVPPEQLRNLAMEASRDDIRAAIKKALVEKAGSEDTDFYEMEEYLLMPLTEALELYKADSKQFADGFYSLLDPQVNQTVAALKYPETLKQAIDQARRSEVRTVPEDLTGLMTPLETVTLQPLNPTGRETILHLNKSSFAEHFAEGSRNLEALREALTKNYDRQPNQRSLFIDLPKPFVVDGRRWISVQLKGIVFDSRQKILAHSEEVYRAEGDGEHARGFADTRLEVFPDGRIENVGAHPSPDGAMTLDKAIREFALSASINENSALAAKKLFAPGAVAYGEFPGLSFNGQPLAFLVLGIDDEMTGAVTRLSENSDTVAEDVTQALHLLHQESYSHPFLHGGNLSSNAARTKWYVHDLDASQLFDRKTDTLSFVTAVQIRDFFYLIEKYVFDRYLSSTHPDAALWGFRNLEAILGAYLLERKRAGALWELETGYLVSGNPVRIRGGIEEVVEHYLRQLESPGQSVVFRDILFPRGQPRPLLAAADLGIEIQSRLRKEGFTDLVRRSEVRGYDEEIFSLARSLTVDQSLAFMPGDEWDAARVIARHYIQLRTLGQLDEAAIQGIFKQALDLFYEQAKADSPVPEEHFDKYWASVVRKAADSYLDYQIEFEPELPETMPREERQALRARMLEYASLTDDYTFHGLSLLINELKDWDRESATNRMLARPAIQDLDPEAQEILSKRLTIEAAFDVMDLVWGTGADGNGLEDRTEQERDQLRESLSHAKAFAIGPKNPDQIQDYDGTATRSEVRNADDDTVSKIKSFYGFGTEGSYREGFYQRVESAVADLMTQKTKTTFLGLQHSLWPGSPSEEFLLKMAVVQNLMADTYPRFINRYQIVLVEGPVQNPYFLHQEGEDFVLAMPWPAPQKPKIIMTRQLFERLQPETLAVIFEYQGHYAYDLDRTGNGRSKESGARYQQELHASLLALVKAELERSVDSEALSRYASQKETARISLVQAKYPDRDNSWYLNKEQVEDSAIRKSDWIKEPQNARISQLLDEAKIPMNDRVKILKQMQRMQISPESLGEYAGFITRQLEAVIRWKNENQKVPVVSAEQVDVRQGEPTYQSKATAGYWSFGAHDDLTRIQLDASQTVPVFVGHNHILLYPMLKILGIQGPLAVINKDYHDDLGGTPYAYDTLTPNLQQVWDYTHGSGRMHEGGVFSTLTREAGLTDLYWIPTEWFRTFVDMDRLSSEYELRDGEVKGIHYGPTGLGVGVPIYGEDAPRIKSYGLRPVNSQSLTDQAPRAALRYHLVPQGALNVISWPADKAYVLSIDLDALNGLPAYQFEEEILRFVQQIKKTGIIFKAVFITPSKDYMINNQTQAYWKELTHFTLLELQTSGILSPQRSEVRSPDITQPTEDDALAREYEGMQTFEAEAELQRREHARSPKAFLLKPRDPAAERKQLESKFRDVVFIRDWIGGQFLTLMSNAVGSAGWKTLDHPISALYPDQAALDGVQLAIQTKGDATVDFLFRVQNKKVMLELRNAETHRSLSRAIASDFIRKRFTPAGQALIRQLVIGKPVDTMIKEVKTARSEVRSTDLAAARRQALISSLARIAAQGLDAREGAKLRATVNADGELIVAEQAVQPGREMESDIEENTRYLAGILERKISPQELVELDEVLIKLGVNLADPSFEAGPLYQGIVESFHYVHLFSTLLTGKKGETVHHQKFLDNIRETLLKIPDFVASAILKGRTVSRGQKERPAIAAIFKTVLANPEHARILENNPELLAGLWGQYVEWNYFPEQQVELALGINAEDGWALIQGNVLGDIRKQVRAYLGGDEALGLLANSLAGVITPDEGRAAIEALEDKSSKGTVDLMLDIFTDLKGYYIDNFNTIKDASEQIKTARMYHVEWEKQNALLSQAVFFTKINQLQLGYGPAVSAAAEAAVSVLDQSKTYFPAFAEFYRGITTANVRQLLLETFDSINDILFRLYFFEGSYDLASTSITATVEPLIEKIAESAVWIRAMEREWVDNLHPYVSEKMLPVVTSAAVLLTQDSFVLSAGEDLALLNWLLTAWGIRARFEEGRLFLSVNGPLGETTEEIERNTIGGFDDFEARAAYFTRIQNALERLQDQGLKREVLDLAVSLGAETREDGARHNLGGQTKDVRSEVRSNNAQNEAVKWQSPLWNLDEIKQVLHEYAQNGIIDWLRLEASLVKLEDSRKMELSQWIEREETIFKDLPSGTWPQLLRNRFYDFRIRGILNPDKRITGLGADYFRYFPVGELWQGLFSRFPNSEFRENFLRFKVQIQSTSNEERRFLDRMKSIDGVQGHGFANSYISGHAGSGDYPYYNHPYELRDHWALLNVMLEGFQKGDFGLFDQRDRSSQRSGSLWEEDDNQNPIHPATYGPYYGIPERTGRFKNHLNKENMIFVVPGNDDVQFLKAGLEEAVRLGKINLERAQDQLRRVMTRDQALELPWEKFLQVFDFQQEWNNGLRIELGDGYAKSEVRTDDTLTANSTRSEVKTGAVVAEKSLVELLERSAKTGAEGGSYKPRMVSLKKDIQFQSRRQNKKVSLTPAVISALQDMTRLARKHDVELEAKIYLQKGRTVGIEYPDDDSKFVIVKSLSQDEEEVTENFKFRFLSEIFISRLHEDIDQKRPELDILQDFQILGTVMEELGATLNVYSLIKNKRVTLPASQLKALTSLDEVRDLITDISRAQFAVTPWRTPYGLDAKAREIPEHDEVMTIHTHPNDNPGPPSAFVRGEDKFGDIYTEQFFKGEIMGIILDTPEGERLLLFHEPEHTAEREAAYHEALHLYWTSRDPSGKLVTEWKPEAQTYTTSQNWQPTLVFLERNLAMISEQPVWLSRRVGGALDKESLKTSRQTPRDRSQEQTERLSAADGFKQQLVTPKVGGFGSLAVGRSEVRQTKKISSSEPAALKSPPLSLKAMIEKIGPTKVFVDVSAPVTSAEQTAKESARLAKAGAEVVFYNFSNAQSDNELVKILETFPKALFHSVSGSWSDALAGAEHAPDEMNLVHYSENEADVISQAPDWAQNRIVYLAGKSGAAAYGLSQVKVLRKAIEADEIKEALLSQLEIAEKNGFYFVSETKSTWMRLQLEAESIVAFAQAA